MRRNDTQDRPVLEREGELERLRGALDAASQGRGGLVAILGPAGVGKTTLLAAACHEAGARGFIVLSARGDDLEPTFGFGVAIQLFREATREPELFSGAAALARPLLEQAEPMAQPGDPDPAFPLLHGLHWVAANLAERAPVLLAVDDVQWADPPSVRYLHYLLGRSDGLRVLTVLTERTGEPSEPGLEDLLGRIRDQGEVLEVGPLGVRSVRRIVGEQIPDADHEVVAACLETTGGNPFLLGELLRTAAEEGTRNAEGLRALRPTSIHRAILVRLGRLGHEAAALAEAAAVAGPGAPVDVLAELAGLEAGPAGEAADGLAAAEILRIASGEASFVHPVLRGALHENLGAATRERMHAEVARILYRREAPATRIAAHLRLCPPLGEDWVVPVLREAARREAGTGAPAVAADYLRRALTEPGRGRDPWLLTELGNAELALGDPAAAQHLETAADAAEDPTLQAMAFGALGFTRFMTGRSAEAIEAYRRALSAFPPGSGGTVEAQVLLNFTAMALITPEAVETIRDVLSVTRVGDGGRPTPAEAARLAGASMAATLEGRRRTAIELARTVIEWSRDTDLAPSLSPFMLTIPAGVLVFTGMYEEARRVLDGAVEHAERQRSLLHLTAALETRSLACLVRGDIRGTLADTDVLLELLEPWSIASVTMRVLRVEALIERGQLEEAQASLALPDGMQDAPPGTFSFLWLPRGRFRIAFALGEWRAALDHALVCGERVEAIEATNPDYMPWRSMAARAADRLGEGEQARALASEELEIARRIGSPRATGVALMALGTALRGPEGIEALQEAVSILDRTGAKLEQARARLELGMVVRRTGRPREARRHLRDAADRARQLGASSIAQAALEELRAAGARPAGPEQTGPESLTPSELRVAELAASGRSNREIAEALFVTLRTVETHLTHAYRKLGIASRRELQAALPS